MTSGDWKVSEKTLNRVGNNEEEKNQCEALWRSRLMLLSLPSNLSVKNSGVRFRTLLGPS